MCQIANRMLGFCSHVCSVIHDERLRACFHLLPYWLPRLIQAIPGRIKTPVILISNEMQDESTDQNTPQPPYRLTTCFSVISSSTPEQGIHDVMKCGIFVLRAMVIQILEGLCYQRINLTFLICLT